MQARRLQSIAGSKRFGNIKDGVMEIIRRVYAIKEEQKNRFHHLGIIWRSSSIHGAGVGVEGAWPSAGDCFNRRVPTKGRSGGPGLLSFATIGRVTGYEGGAR